MSEMDEKEKGRGKQVIGSETGDRSKQAEGYIEEKKADIKKAYEDVKRDLDDKK